MLKGKRGEGEEGELLNYSGATVVIIAGTYKRYPISAFLLRANSDKFRLLVETRRKKVKCSFRMTRARKFSNFYSVICVLFEEYRVESHRAGRHIN